HLETTKPLAFCYLALEDYELFDEIVNDISDKYPEKEILKLWSEFRQTGSLPAGELIHFKKSFPVFYAEFTSNVHEVTPEYLADIESEKPLRQTLARELWLQTEHLWAQFPGFIEALRNH
ncbi:MAG: tetratricopeptide repeat protein, partial [Rikenellaceae bacterium]|nr:tetratricopeptide repeat protein [Rikenellaceae bacterium]